MKDRQRERKKKKKKKCNNICHNEHPFHNKLSFHAHILLSKTETNYQLPLSLLFAIGNKIHMPYRLNIDNDIT
jgi:hypothetical protein